jgi:hypothetical protein
MCSFFSFSFFFSYYYYYKVSLGIVGGFLLEKEEIGLGISETCVQKCVDDWVKMKGEKEVEKALVSKSS